MFLGQKWNTRHFDTSEWHQQVIWSHPLSEKIQLAWLSINAQHLLNRSSSCRPSREYLNFPHTLPHSTPPQALLPSCKHIQIFTQKHALSPFTFKLLCISSVLMIRCYTIKLLIPSLRLTNTMSTTIMIECICCRNITLNYMSCFCLGQVSFQNKDTIWMDQRKIGFRHATQTFDIAYWNTHTSPLPIPKEEEEERRYLQEFLWLPSVAPGEVDIPAGCFVALTR